MRKEPLRNDQMQIVLRARHRDVKETTLFLDFCNSARREIRRQSRRRCLEETLISAPAPSPNEWSKGLNSPRRGVARQPGRWWHPVGRE